MPQYDRLSALITRFALRVAPEHHQSANLIVYEDVAACAPNRVEFATNGATGADPGAGEVIAFSARAEWGGSANPLFSALPDRIELVIGDDQETAILVRLLKTEGDNQRCGSGAVLDRLGEVLMVRLLRAQIERGAANTGLLGGLADPRLSRAIVALHEDPGKQWRSEDLAGIAGLSLSRFAELFANVVGVTPIAYLRRWRMILARQDVERGDRIQAVARRYGYGSSEAMSRCFRRQFGETPKHARKLAAG